MKRRRLVFHSFDELLAEVERLKAGGYERAGNWTLSQICVHLRVFQDMSMRGFEGIRLGWPLRVAGKAVLYVTLLTRWIPRGAQAPARFQPAAAAGNVDDAGEIAQFLESARAVAGFQGAFYPSPLFGKMTTAQWRKIHLIHGAHHLGFLIPAAG